MNILVEMSVKYVTFRLILYYVVYVNSLVAIAIERSKAMFPIGVLALIVGLATKNDIFILGAVILMGMPVISKLVK